ncbi:hypothetical protein [Campylobacter californiensis]|nr:hypothetical protein [Campylobacter sp. RM13119]
MIQNTNNKGAKMALPFIAGVALGALAVVAYNKRDKVKECAADGFEKGKETAKDLFKKSKDIAGDVKEFTQEKILKTQTKSEKKPAAKKSVKKPSTAKAKPQVANDQA